MFAPLDFLSARDVEHLYSMQLIQDSPGQKLGLNWWRSSRSSADFITNISGFRFQHTQGSTPAGLYMPAAVRFLVSSYSRISGDRGGSPPRLAGYQKLTGS
jgi:hypothetical protein